MYHSYFQISICIAAFQEGPGAGGESHRRPSRLSGRTSALPFDSFRLQGAGGNPTGGLAAFQAGLRTNDPPGRSFVSTRRTSSFDSFQAYEKEGTFVPPFSYGAGGNRTPVQKPIRYSFFHHSLHILIPQAACLQTGKSLR